MAWYDTAGASNGPTGTVNGVIETMRRVDRSWCEARISASTAVAAAPSLYAAQVVVAGATRQTVVPDTTHASIQQPSAG